MRKTPVAERFWSKVRKTDACWEWIASKDSNGYGTIAVDGATKRAHRVAYELLIGPIAEGLQLDHLCRVRACVNPAHLEPVTMAENIRRGKSHNGSKTHCPSGHGYTPENTTRRGHSRYCRQCALAATRRYKARLRAQAGEAS